MTKAGSSWYFCSSAGPLAQGTRNIPLYLLLSHSAMPER